MSLGSNITEARKLRGLTQENLAELVGVSFQAVSSWERDENLPDTARLKSLAEALNTSLDALFDEGKREWTLKAPHSDPEHMYTYIKAKAQSEKLEQTLKALPLIREKHKGQFRKGMVDRAPYITHPLTLACHALAMGIVDDDVIAALLLHDVIEDTDTKPEELPVNERVRKAVCLVSYNTYEGDKETIKPKYYEKIKENPLASLVKCIDRCNNLSCMADGFARGKMATYVVQTERYVLPLLDVVKAVPEWNNAAWLLSYQITSLLEAFKRLL
ncbi:MAG: helix-turn-helix domain-containing protein [Clostridia bacterium]|nr:helix-turn-helix domain-containing protein [Clostridia bacterium]